MAKIEIEIDKCKGCSFCIEFCPKKIVVFSDDLNVKGIRYAKQIEQDKCNACKICGIMCPEAIITVFK